MGHLVATRMSLYLVPVRFELRSLLLAAVMWFPAPTGDPHLYHQVDILLAIHLVMIPGGLSYLLPAHQRRGVVGLQSARLVFSLVLDFLRCLFLELSSALVAAPLVFLHTSPTARRRTDATTSEAAQAPMGLSEPR